MALADIIARNKKRLVRGPGGVLSEEAPEGVQSLADSAGLSAPPTTPLGQGMIGANADQQKMAGTPQQKQAALQISQQPDQTLSGAMRRGQVRTEQTAQEQALTQKSENLKNLGSLGDRVSDFMQAQRQALQQKAAAEAPGVDVATAGEFQGKDLASLQVERPGEGEGAEPVQVSLKDVLGELRKDPSNMQLQLEVNKALGYDINRQLSPEQINDLYQSAVEAISAGGAGAVDDNLNVDDLIASGQFGYEAPELANLLGVPEEQIGSMTVGQIRQTIDRLQQEEYSKAAELEQKAVSGQLGAAERQLARQQARETSATGIRSTEADVANLEKQIEDADLVSFGGKQYRVDELLQDSTLSNLITEYMQSGPDSEIRQRIDANEPELKAFIDKNQNLLADAATALSGGATGFQEIQTFNTGLAQIGSNKLDPNLAKELIPGYGELQASKVDVASNPFLSYSTSLDPNKATNLSSEINAQFSKNPDLGKELGELTPEDLAKLDIAGGGRRWEDYKTMQRQHQEAMAAQSPDDLINQLYVGAGNAEQVAAKLQQDRMLDIFEGNGGIDNKTKSLLDADNDGIMDSPEEIRSRLNSLSPDLTLKETLDKGATPYQRQNLGETRNPRPSKKNDYDSTKISSSLYKQLSREGALADGRLDKKELKAANLSLQEMLYLKDNKGNAGTVDRDYLNKLFVKKRASNTEDQIQKLRDKFGPITQKANGVYSPNLFEMLDALKKLKRQSKGDRTIDRDMLDAYVETFSAAAEKRPADRALLRNSKPIEITAKEKAQMWSDIAYDYGPEGFLERGVGVVSPEAANVLKKRKVKF